MRNRFGNWGAGLSDAEFACALAALGTVDPRAEASWGAERLVENIRDRVRKGPIDWRFEERRLTLDASALSKAWQLFVLSGGSGKARIQLSRLVLQFQKIDPSWLRERLLHPAVQTSSVEIVHVFGAFVVPRGGMGSYEPGKKGIESYEISEEVTRAEPARRTSRKPKSSARYLQAQIQSLANPAKPRRVTGSLRPGGSYTAAIQVGLPDPKWTRVSRPIPLPPEPEGHRLTVIFEEPRVSPKPQVQVLWLPPTGSSEPAYFSFRAPEDGEIAARVTVLHANRVLQTGLLHAPVGDGRWTFELDAMPRIRLEGLAHRSRFDAALIVSQNGRTTAAAQDNVVVLAFDDGAIRELTEFLNDQISAISDDPERYEGLESPGSVELLRSLARMGATVHDQLCKHTALVELADARRIHITSAKAGSFLPAELLYRFETPSPTAGLCPHALAALESGDCAADCPSDRRQTVCPLGFWGLSKVIERHAHEREDQRQVTRDFELRPEPVRRRSLLPLAGSALLAASGKAAIVKKDAVTELLKKLQDRGPAALATTWAEWEKHIDSDQPRLLVLLPHHERAGNGFEVLEIGEDSRLETVDILDGMVRRKDGPHPVVLLMGCETNLARISFANPASLFRDHGAAVVVSTIATILGRHASPATAVLVELLDQMADGKSTFGDVMLRLRQKLVAQSTPMALGLTSYGDADWILTRKEA